MFKIPYSINLQISRSIIIGILAWTSTLSFSQSCDSLTGFWINQDSSLLHITSETDGMLTGNYQSNASDDSRLFPFFGYVNQYGKFPTLTFAVSWAEFGSMTSWTGYCKVEEGIPVITTMWHLVRPYVEKDWERFITNTSTFKPLHP